jgi:hypothetical protein
MPHTVKPSKVLAWMKANDAEWPDFQAFMRTKRTIDQPMTLGEVASMGSVGFACYAARMLPEETHADARRLAVACAMGNDSCLVELFKSKTDGSPLVDEVLAAALAYADGSIPLESLMAETLRVSRAIQRMSAVPAAILAAAVSAGAPYAWGAAACAHGDALQAMDEHAKVEAPKEAKRDYPGIDKDGLKSAVDRIRQEAVAATEAYGAFLVKEVFG